MDDFLADPAGWLVLTRRPGERVTLTVPAGTESTTIVVDFNGFHKSGGAIRMAFFAPRAVAIERDER